MKNYELYINMLNSKRCIENICKENDIKLWKQIYSIKFEILCIIYTSKSISPSILVEELNIAKSNIANACKNLEKEGKITHTNDKSDHRIIYYELTSIGENYLQDCLKKLEEIYCLKLEEKEINLLNDNYANIINILNKAREGVREDA